MLIICSIFVYVVNFKNLNKKKSNVILFFITLLIGFNPLILITIDDVKNFYSRNDESYLSVFYNFEFILLYSLLFCSMDKIKFNPKEISNTNDKPIKIRQKIKLFFQNRYFVFTLDTFIFLPFVFCSLFFHMV